MTEKKHILVITQYFYPEPFRINDIAREWVNRGYKVTVLTGIPNYPEGKFYKGYGWAKKRRENLDGVEIIRIPLISRGKSAVRLIMNYYSFVFSGFFWSRFVRLDADLVFTFEVSPMIQAQIGSWYSARKKIPNYLYVQDLWPDNLEIVGGIHNKFILNHYDRMAKKIYKRCTKIFATSPSFVDTVRSRIEKDRDKVIYWPQYAEDFYKPSVRKSVCEIPDDDSFKVIFTGNIGTAQGLEILPEAAALLKNENVKFVIVGNGRYREEFQNEVRRLEVEDKFVMIPRQPPEKIPELLAACDAAFISFQKSKLWEMTIPAKLQSYMACGMPVIASAQGETKRIIDEAGCGKCCEIGNTEALGKMIVEMMTDDLKTMGNNSRRYFDEHFDKKILMDQMDKYFV